MTGIAQTSERAHADLGLEGMTCASCAARIERRLNRLDGVHATVNFATERAAVEFDPRLVGLDDVLGAVNAIGYHAVPGAPARDEPDPTRPLLRRLVAAAL